MPHQRIIANITAALVLLPTTFFAVIGSWLFFGLFYAALRGAPYVGLVAASVGALTATLGCIGVLTLWAVYFSPMPYTHPFSPPPAPLGRASRGSGRVTPPDVLGHGGDSMARPARVCLATPRGDSLWRYASSSQTRCGLTLRSSRNCIATPSTWQKELAMSPATRCNSA
jgi:hypothetical protein